MIVGRQTDTNAPKSEIKKRPSSLCMAGGPGLEPVWRSGPGDPDYAVRPENVLSTRLLPPAIHNFKCVAGLWLHKETYFC